MKTKVFISYAKDDYSKTILIKRELAINPFFEAVVIEDERNPNIPLSILIKNGISSSFCIIPILSSRSVNNQWINQEIGYAEGVNTPIIPIIEVSVLDELKGFVNKQNQCPYKYTGKSIEMIREENKGFMSAFRLLIRDLEFKYLSPGMKSRKPIKSGVFTFLSYLM